MKRIILLTLAIFLLSVSFAKPGYLGIVINDFTSPQVNGVLINDIIENSAAQEYGLQENDIITAVNDIAVQKKEEIIALLSTHNYGEAVKISFVRNGKATSQMVNLGNKPEPVTIKISKEDKEDGEHWIFSEDNTEVVVKSTNGMPVSVFTKDENGHTKLTKDFAAFEQKFGYIKKIKSDREKCSCNCKITQYTFYKITKDPVDTKTAVNNTLLVDKFNITPNPSSGKIRVDIASNEKGTPSFSIFNINGDVVQTDMLQNFVGEYSKEYNLENLAKGTYMIQLKIGDKMTSKKFIIQ